MATRKDPVGHVIREAQDRGFSLLKTRLMKLLYLAGVETLRSGMPRVTEQPVVFACPPEEVPADSHGVPGHIAKLQAPPADRTSRGWAGNAGSGTEVGPASGVAGERPEGFHAEGKPLRVSRLAWSGRGRA